MIDHFRGGMHFPPAQPITWLDIPSSVSTTPLRITSPHKPVITLGQSVTAGQRLTEPLSPADPCIVSPIDGVVHAITPWPADTFHQHKHQRKPSIRKIDTLYDIHITPNHEETSAAIPVAPPSDRTLDHWFDILRSNGPWPQDEIGCDLITQLETTRHQKPSHLICIGLDAFPLYSDRSSLLMTYPDDAVLGTRILGDIVGAKHVQLTLAHSAKLISQLKRPGKSFNVKCICTDNIYPAADPTLSAYYFAKHTKLPASQPPSKKNIVIITPWTAIRIARWITRRALDIVQPIMIAEPNRNQTPSTHYALPGSDICNLSPLLHGSCEALSDRLVIGNPLTGSPIAAPNAAKGTLPPTVRHGIQLISILPSNPRLEPEPCITCGWCTDVCPTDLQPVHLAELIAIKPNAPKINKQLNFCIECGLCSHVCPSHLPLTQLLAAAKTY
ncbi:4Fe-4S dicluster domain-containing protein [Poriferisphaera sp. WC338]|uniref:4Fe-4S dicluster domain-containing protein n=1 Tax=Poriferisphaera sp. WC338 TaxID=3425129 RepID=UPI003D81BE69